MTSRLWDFLIHPDTFFRDLAAGPNEYKIPLIIVGTCMVLDAIRQFLLMDWMRQVLLPLLSSMTSMPQLNDFFVGAFSILLFAAVVQNIPAFIAYWLIIAAAFFIISSYFSQEGTIYKTIIATGWGMAPLILYNAISIQLFLMYRDVMTITISPEAFNQTASRYSGYSHRSSFSGHEDFSQYVQFNQQYIEHAQIDFALYAVAMLCCSIFWLYAVKNIRNIPFRQAFLSVVLPVVLFLAIILGIKMMNGWA